MIQFDFDEESGILLPPGYALVIPHRSAPMKPAGPRTLIRLGLDPSIPEGEMSVVLWGGAADGRLMTDIEVRRTAAIIVPVLAEDGWTVLRYERIRRGDKIVYCYWTAASVGPRGDL